VLVGKIPNVGVAPALIVSVTLPAGAPRHTPVAGFVWHTEMATGSETLPVSAAAVILPVTPTLTVATANTPTPVDGEMFTIPLLSGVAASATMSGIGVGDADNGTVLTPG
jgi:hypothetical protein